MILKSKSKKELKNLKKFRNAKFNYAKFIKKYYIEKGNAYISAKVNSIEDIVSKYSTRGYEWINKDFADYIEESAYYIPVEQSIILEICGGNFSEKEKLLITRVIKDYFGLKLGDKIIDLEINKRKSLVLLGFGIISLAFVMLLSKIEIISTIMELFLIILWFFIWEFGDLAWLNRREIYVQKIEAGQLASLKITFNNEIENIEKDLATSERNNNDIN